MKLSPRQADLLRKMSQGWHLFERSRGLDWWFELENPVNTKAEKVHRLTGLSLGWNKLIDRGTQFMENVKVYRLTAAGVKAVSELPAGE